MTDTPSISVVLPVYNGSATIRGTLLALAAQAGLRERVEVIVVDNGSTDSTPEVVRQFDVQLLEAAKRGPSAARNTGLRHAGGEVIVHLDADTVPSRRWLAEIVEPFRDPSVVLVGGKTVSYPNASGAAHYAAASGRYEPENSFKHPIFPFAPSLNLAVRRSAALAAGGWDESLTTGEDIDFCQRVLRAVPGSRLVHSPKALLFHHERTSDEALRRQARSYGEGAAALYLKYPAWFQVDLAIALRAATMLGIRGIAPLWLRVAKFFRPVSREEFEFAVYHRLWIWWWLRGFLSVYLGRDKRPAA